MQDGQKVSVGIMSIQWYMKDNNRSNFDSPYKTIAELREIYGQSRATINAYLKAIQNDPRYAGQWIDLGDKRPRRINSLIYEDYLHYRTRLRDRNLRKTVPPYDPVEVKRQRGESNVTFLPQINEDEIKEIVRNTIKEIILRG